ncbi:MAG: hypothetical protein LBP63_07135 [Prevotellaceae bacterium]|jgi:preprotein translocase subunit Sec61beta|nr:hypothetical protein [Prevotellaceae bacterium]
MPKPLKIDETYVIYFTAAAIIISGFLRLTGFRYSAYFFNIVLLPYIATRGFYYLRIWRSRNENLSLNARYRLYVYAAVFITVLLSILDFFSADFFVIFLIMVDFLLLQNKDENNET